VILISRPRLLIARGRPCPDRVALSFSGILVKLRAGCNLAYNKQPCASQPFPLFSSVVFPSSFLQPCRPDLNIDDARPASPMRSSAPFHLIQSIRS